MSAKWGRGNYVLGLNCITKYITYSKGIRQGIRILKEDYQKY